MSQQQGPVIFNGRYELHRRLGRGGMAEVYLARDQMLDRAVAVKVLFPALATDPGFVERFRREAQSAAGLNHPTIVGVYDWGEANGTYFIVMEYVEGESLAELIQSEGRLHPDRAAEIASDIAAALGFAHRNGGVIHRDVKPGNVMITREGAVKVADFGIARAMTDASDQNLTKTGSVMGTATYFSPEQARGAGVDPRSDVYSLGCVIYEMVTGRPPFQGDNAVAIAYKHVQEAPVSPRLVDPAIPDTLEAIVLKCLAKNPANRYPSAQDLRADLTRFLQGARIMAEPVLAPPGDPGATGLMAPTGYMNATVAQAPTSYGGDGYGDQWNEYDGYDDEEEPPKSNKAFLAVLVLLVLLLGGVLYLAAKAMQGEDPKDMVTVPTVIGLKQEAAEAALKNEGLKPKIEQQASDKEVGIVLNSSPGAGEDVETGSEVTLTVSSGKETAPVPDVMGLSEADARKQLEPTFIVDRVTQAGDDETKDTVIAQDPPPDTPLAVGSTVTITISTGAETATIPQVAGRSFDEAKGLIEGLGFDLQVTRVDEENDTVAPGTVIRTDPAEGQSVARGQTVTVVVSTGSEKITVEDVVGEDEAAARALLQGLDVQVTYVGVNDPEEDGRVQRQQPRAGSEVDAGSRVTLIVGEFRDEETTTSTLFPIP